MSARGDYRAIYTVLWNGPDWQSLPPESRLVWLALKGNCGPTGIACLPAVEHQVARWTGLDVAAVSRAFAVLQTQGWMVSGSDGGSDVVWVRGGITYEPSRHVGNANHRQSARDHVAGLPHVPIVAAFVRAHPEWFPPAEAQPVIPWAFSDTRPAPKLLGPGYVPDGMGDRIGDRKAITETETETETEDGVTTGDAGASPDNQGRTPRKRRSSARPPSDDPSAPSPPTWVHAVHEALLEHAKVFQPHGKIGGTLAAVVRATGATPDQLREAVRDYDAHLYAHGRRAFVLTHFAAELPKLLAMQGEPYGDGHGTSTARGRYVLGDQA